MMLTWDNLELIYIMTNFEKTVEETLVELKQYLNFDYIDDDIIPEVVAAIENLSKITQSEFDSCMVKHI